MLKEKNEKEKILSETEILTPWSDRNLFYFNNFIKKSMFILKNNFIKFCVFSLLVLSDGL